MKKNNRGREKWSDNSDNKKGKDILILGDEDERWQQNQKWDRDALADRSHISNIDHPVCSGHEHLFKWQLAELTGSQMRITILIISECFWCCWKFLSCSLKPPGKKKNDIKCRFFSVITDPITDAAADRDKSGDKVLVISTWQKCNWM